MGWKDWHFGTSGTLNKKGEDVSYKRAIIDKEGVLTYQTIEAVTSGYGYFALDFGKHILGLLTYIEDRISNYKTGYIPKKYYSNGELIESTEVDMHTAI